MSLEKPQLINFDKQRYIYNFLSNIVDLRPWKRSSTNGLAELEAVLSQITNDLQLLRFDKRAVKDAAMKETKERDSKNSKNTKVFTSLVINELEKFRRDARQRDVLDRHFRDQSKVFNKNRLPAQQERRTSKPSRLGGLLRAVRPLSMAFGGTNTSPSPGDKSILSYDLPDVTTVETRHRPSVTVNLATAITTIPAATRGNGMFKIVCDDGADYLLQATSEEDLEEWVRLCSAVRALSVSRVVFGIPIAKVCQRENELIPRVVTKLLTEIEARGLEEVGIYRVPGSLSNMNALKNAFDSGLPVDMDDDRWFDVNTIAGGLKLYLRELPDSLLTAELFSEFTAIAKLSEEGEQIFALAQSTQKLPINNYFLLKRIIEHLISDHGDVNKMHAINLSIVFSMSLLPNNDPFAASSDLGAIQTILRTMISAPSRIFSDDFMPSNPQSLSGLGLNHVTTKDEDVESGFG
ncbi:Rho GTPase activation protein [Lipomyces japonicus]|uniref:Rho GTPase activation protein n=1 Tax=Lipomyces japonicus TaxID=56871 RepID=UPI0034CD7BED